jgi:hypothetical protein
MFLAHLCTAEHGRIMSLRRYGLAEAKKLRQYYATPSFTTYSNVIVGFQFYVLFV